MSDRTISASRTVPAPPAAIWAVLTDPARHAEIDGSGTVRGALGRSSRLAGVGDRFGMRMRQGLPYPIRNVVVEFEPERRIAWRHPGRHRWRYELEPVDGGTRVTETFDWTAAPLGFLYGPLGFLDAHSRSIPRTLERLEQVVTT